MRFSDEDPIERFGERSVVGLVVVASAPAGGLSQSRPEDGSPFRRRDPAGLDQHLSHRICLDLPRLGEARPPVLKSIQGIAPTGRGGPCRSIVLEYPLLREGEGTEIERCTWKAKYPTQEAIDQKRNELGDIGFRREMLLQVVPEEGQDVLPDDIHYYDDPPFDDGNYLAHGVDLAISTKESADYTAIVSGEVTWPSGKLEIYVQPNPIIRRMTFTETMEAIDNVRHSTVMSSEFFVEAVAYQAAAIEEMERRAFSVQINEKRARLRVAARYIKMGVVKFPRTRCEQLLTQLLGFGGEKHDDAVDALVYLIFGLVGEGIAPQEVRYV